ncbi:MAG: cell division protein FtsQ/DivIB [Bdellovibrionales bacterium]|nr:cell division protein FtsQ/DivIB [Bdellovibrionales bacterium]
MKKVFVALFLVFFIGLVALGYSVQSNYFSLKEIVVIINGKKIKDPKVMDELKQYFYPAYNQALWKIDLVEYYTKLLSLPEYSGVKIKRFFPSKLIVELESPPPLLMLLNHKNELFTLNSSGEYVEQLPLNKSMDLPLLTGLVLEKSPELRRSVIKFYASIPPKGWFSKSNISELNWNKKNGLEVFMKENSIKILFGQSGFQNKIEKVERVLNYLQQNQIEGRVIDSRFSKKVVVRPRNNP